MIEHDDELNEAEGGAQEVLISRNQYENLLMGVFGAGLVMGMFLTIFAFWVALNGLH